MSHLNEHLHHGSHGWAIDRERGGAEKTDVDHLANLFLETKIEPRIDHTVHSFLLHRAAHPLDQIHLSELRIHRKSPGHKLKDNHAEAIYVTFFSNPQRVRILCTKKQNPRSETERILNKKKKEQWKRANLEQCNRRNQQRLTWTVVPSQWPWRGQSLQLWPQTRRPTICYWTLRLYER